MKKYIFMFLCVSISLSINAQELLPLSHQFQADLGFNGRGRRVKEYVFNIESVKPIVNPYLNHSGNIHKMYFDKRWFTRKLYRESFLEIKNKKQILYIDPIVDLRYGKEGGNSLYQNTRGYFIRGYISEKLWFQTSFFENQARFPKYINSYIDSFAVVPGMINPKLFKTDAYDYAIAMGQISFSLNQYYNVQFGQGKNFIGNGYRSLMLSDNTAPYLFLRNNFKWKKFEYTHIIASLQNTNLNNVLYAPHDWYSGFQKKTANFSYFSYKPTKNIEIGLFESCIFQIKDSISRFNVNYLNPIILSKTAQYGLSDENNCMIGLQITAKLPLNFIFYSQFVVDDIEFNHLFAKRMENKTALQLGLKKQSSIFSHKVFCLVEYNSARPYTYAHSSPVQSYTHYNQSLAHPLGANFSEFIAILRYRINRFSFNLHFNYANTGQDISGINYGHNPFQSDVMVYNGSLDINNLEQGQGIDTKITHLNLSLNYLFNPKNRLEAFALWHYRGIDILGVKENTSFFTIGLRNNLWNNYFDF